MAGLVAASYGAAYWKGRQDGWDKREEIAIREAREAQRLLERLAAIRQKVTVQVITKYRTRTKVVDRDREVIREIKVADSCELSSEWVRVHDTAAGVSDSPSRTVGASAAVETVAGNYLSCRLDAERLKALQSWVTEQAKVK